MPTNIQFILLRHAEKGITPFEDPHLTAKGFQQAQNILTLVQQNKLPQPTHIWSSQKIRTTQTLQPLAHYFSITEQKTQLLNLQQSQENTASFRQRIELFLTQLTESSSHAQTSHTQPAVHFACTHYDWIEEAMSLIPCDKNLNSFEFSHWAPAQYIGFKYNSTLGLWNFLTQGAHT